MPAPFSDMRNEVGRNFSTEIQVNKTGAKSGFSGKAHPSCRSLQILLFHIDAIIHGSFPCEPMPQAIGESLAFNHAGRDSPGHRKLPLQIPSKVSVSDRNRPRPAPASHRQY